jgi:hypothetical protein
VGRAPSHRAGANAKEGTIQSKVNQTCVWQFYMLWNSLIYTVLSSDVGFKSEIERITVPGHAEQKSETSYL